MWLSQAMKGTTSSKPKPFIDATCIHTGQLMSMHTDWQGAIYRAAEHGRMGAYLAWQQQTLQIMVGVWRLAGMCTLKSKPAATNAVVIHVLGS